MVYLSNGIASLKGDNNRAELARLFSHKGLVYRTAARVIRGILLFETKSTPIFNLPNGPLSSFMTALIKWHLQRRKLPLFYSNY